MSVTPRSLKHEIRLSRWFESKSRVEDSREDCKEVSGGTEEKKFPDEISLPRGLKVLNKSILETFLHFYTTLAM